MDDSWAAIKMSNAVGPHAYHALQRYARYTTAVGGQTSTVTVSVPGRDIFLVLSVGDR